MPTSTDLPIRLTMPAQPQNLRLARMTAASLAADLGFSVQDIEDARVAVDELAAVLIEGAEPGAELDLAFGSVDGTLLVEGTVRGGRTDAPQVHAVAAELLSLVTDDFSVAADSRGPRFAFRKRAQGPTG